MSRTTRAACASSMTFRTKPSAVPQPLGGGVYAATKRFGDPANSYSDGSYARLHLFGAYRMQLAKSVMTAQLNINNVTDAEYYNLRARWSNIPAEPLNVVWLYSPGLLTRQWPMREFHLLRSRDTVQAAAAGRADDTTAFL